jgi:Sulfotransferase domain
LVLDAQKVRTILGRTRAAVNYVLGRQAMAKGVTAYDDDVWIVSYPRSGNTWTRFLIANLVARGETVDWSNIERHVPDIYLNQDPELRSLPRPRYFKSHEAYRPDYRRVVFIVRDPRDVAVSYYHFLRKSNRLPAEAPLAEFIPSFLEGRIDPFGSWGENVGSWLGARRGTPGFVVVRYEDLLENAEAQLARVADVLQVPADNGQLRHAVDNSRADRMRNLEKSQRGQHKYLKTSREDIPFVRAAKSGQWQTDLAPEAARQIESAWGPVMRELGYLQ